MPKLSDRPPIRPAGSAPARASRGAPASAPARVGPKPIAPPRRRLVLLALAGISAMLVAPQSGVLAGPLGAVLAEVWGARAADAQNAAPDASAAPPAPAATEPPGASPAPAAFAPIPGDIADLSEFVWKKRPVVVFADSPDDPAFVEQMALIAARWPELAARDVVVIADTTPEPLSSVRRKLRPRGFSLVLITKDGQVSIRKPLPWSGREIIRAIDKMPLRREEVRNGASTGVPASPGY